VRVTPQAEAGSAARVYRRMGEEGIVMTTVSGRRLVRPRDDRWIAGVCAGIGRRFGLPPNLVRLLFVLSVLLPGPQFIIYLALWILIPNE